MSTLVGKKAPEITAPAVLADNSIKGDEAMTPTSAGVAGYLAKHGK